jgi:type IV pilus assembly protein PilE
MMRIKMSKGFSLIELLIVVVIVGILGSIGYPRYTEYVVRAARVDAITLLLDVANKQEQYFADNRSYTNDLEALKVSNVSENKYFNITLAIPTDGLSFTATAAPVPGGVADDPRCQTLTINDIGVKGSTGTANANECWER